MRVLSVDPGRKHLGLCVVNANETDRSGMHDVIEFWTVRETPTHVSSLKAALEDTLRDVEYDEVVIERQPPKNSTMKRLEHLFEMYFAMIEKPVFVVDARHKLRFASCTPHWTGSSGLDGKGSWSYIRRKKISVSTVTKFLAATPERNGHMRERFEKAPKKDDYADALLQAQAYAHVVRHLHEEKAAADAIVKIRPFPKPRAPKQGGRLTKANVAYLLEECRTLEDIGTALAQNTKVRNAFTTFFGSAESFLQSRVVYNEKKRRPTIKQPTDHHPTPPCHSLERQSNDCKK